MVVFASLLVMKMMLITIKNNTSFDYKDIDKEQIIAKRFRIVN